MNWQRITAGIAAVNVRTFGSNVRYIHCESGHIYTTRAIYDPVHLRDQVIGGDQGTDSYTPIFGVNRCDLQAPPAINDRIVLAECGPRESRTFIVREVEEDGWSAYRLHCHEAE